MRLDLEKIFVLDLDFERGKRYYSRNTSKELDESFERFFNIFGKDPDNLIKLMDNAVNQEIKEMTLLALKGTQLTDEDETHFIPVIKEEDEIKLDDSKT
jgi:hypothetical protein